MCPSFSCIDNYIINFVSQYVHNESFYNMIVGSWTLLPHFYFFLFRSVWSYKIYFFLYSFRFFLTIFFFISFHYFFISVCYRIIFIGYPVSAKWVTPMVQALGRYQYIVRVEEWKKIFFQPLSLLSNLHLCLLFIHT